MIYLTAAWWTTWRTMRRHRQHPTLTTHQRELRVYGAAVACGIAVILCWYPATFCAGLIAAMLAGVPWDLTTLPDERLSQGQASAILAGISVGFIVCDLAGLYALRRTLRWLIPETTS